jgi:hypothetical protein
LLLLLLLTPTYITPFEIITGREPTYKHLRVFGCKVWSRHGSQEKFKKFVSSKGVPGTFVGFEGTHVVQILTEKGKIIRATAAHFQEKRTHSPGGAKRQCLNPLDEDDEDVESLPFRTAWFDEDGTDEIQHGAVQGMAASRRSARLQVREHEPSGESI